MSDAHPAPLPAAEVARRFEPAPARADNLSAITRSFFVAGGSSPPEVAARVVPVERRSPGGGQGVQYEVVLSVDGVRLGERASPRPVEGRGFRRGELRFDPRRAEEVLTAFQPDHLARAPVPREVVRPHRTVFEPGGRDVKRPTTVFTPDERRVFRDTAYPWSTVGLVETNRGAGSGVMIGPRHLLTVSHVIDWEVPAPFAADWVKFTPSAFDDDEPFGHAYANHVYWYVKEDGDGGITTAEGQFDYAVVVLDSRMGERTGWMGARGYSDAWDGLAAWSHMGYPTDLNSGQRPCFQGGFPLDGTATQPDAHQEILHKADVFPGQSGGPVFGWWDGDAGPRAVAVQSWQNSGSNGASGGDDLRSLVVQARTDFA